VSSWREIAIAYVVVLLTRAAVVFAGRAISHGVRRGKSPTPPVSWSIVLVWGGLRGALSLVLALALSAALPHRELVVRMTAGVVVLSLLLQGLTMAPLIRRLGLSTSG
jgi:CPA1 family monovalent cation:H+ antiporter